MPSSYLDQVLSQADLAAKVAIGKTAPTNMERGVLAATIAGEIDPRFSQFGTEKTAREIASILEVIETRHAVNTPGRFGSTGLRDPVTGKVVGSVAGGYKSRADVALQNMQFSTWNDTRGRHTAAANLARFGPQINAAIDAYYAGAIQPVVQNATHYWNPSIVNPTWEPSIVNKKDIGPHRFGRHRAIDPPSRSSFDAKPASLKPGAKGRAVEALQASLAALGFNAGKVDGKYGPSTAKAVEAFQKAARLNPDGVAGPNTQTAINAALAVSDTPAMGFVSNALVDPSSPGFKGVPSASFASPTGKGFVGSPELPSVSVMARDFAARDRARQALQQQSSVTRFAPARTDSPAQAAISNLVEPVSFRSSTALSSARDRAALDLGLFDRSPSRGFAAQIGATRGGFQINPAGTRPGLPGATGASATPEFGLEPDGFTSSVDLADLVGQGLHGSSVRVDPTGFRPDRGPSVADMARATMRDSERAVVDLASRSRAGGRMTTGRSVSGSSGAFGSLPRSEIAERAERAAAAAQPQGFGRFGGSTGSPRAIEAMGGRSLDPVPISRTDAPSLAEIEMPSPETLRIASQPSTTGVSQKESLPISAISTTGSPRALEAMGAPPLDPVETVLSPTDRVAQVFDIVDKAPDLIQLAKPAVPEPPPALPRPAPPRATPKPATPPQPLIGKPSPLATPPAGTRRSVTARALSSASFGQQGTPLGDAMDAGFREARARGNAGGFHTGSFLDAMRGRLSDSSPQFAALEHAAITRGPAAVAALGYGGRGFGGFGAGSAGSGGERGDRGGRGGVSSGRGRDSRSRDIEASFTDRGGSAGGLSAAEAAREQAGDSGDSEESKVLCTAFHKWGYLPTRIKRAEAVWSLRNVDERTRSAYRYWAKPLIRAMERHHWLRKPVFHLIVRPWAYEAAHRANPQRFPETSPYRRAHMAVFTAWNKALGAVLNDETLADEFWKPA